MSKKSKELKLAKLSWTLLEHKCRYYVFDAPSIGDYEYDILEKEYEALAKELQVPPSVSDMVGFDETRESCKQVLNKLRRQRAEQA
jgi:NAD-dependent DNA ligase